MIINETNFRFAQHGFTAPNGALPTRIVRLAAIRHRILVQVSQFKLKRKTLNVFNKRMILRSLVCSLYFFDWSDFRRQKTRKKTHNR